MLKKTPQEPKETDQEIDEPSKISAEKETSGDLKELLEKSLHWSQIIYEQNKAIKSRLTWMAVLAWLKLVLVLVPLIIGVIFLPPLIRQVWGQYASLLGGESSGGGSYNINSIIEEAGVDNVKELLKLLENK